MKCAKLYLITVATMKDNKLVKLLGVLVLFYIGTHHESVNGAAVFSIDLGNEWMKVKTRRNLL